MRQGTNLTLKTFLDNLNTFFMVECETYESRITKGSQVVVSIEFELVEVRNLGFVKGKELFELRFIGLPIFPIQKGTYKFTHDVIEPFLLSIEMVNEDEEGFYYESLSLPTESE